MIAITIINILILISIIAIPIILKNSNDETWFLAFIPFVGYFKLCKIIFGNALIGLAMILPPFILYLNYKTLRWLNYKPEVSIVGLIAPPIHIILLIIAAFTGVGLEDPNAIEEE